MLSARRVSRLLVVALVAFVLFSTIGCKKLLAGLAKGDDAGVDAAVAVATADPGASATAAASATATPSATAKTPVVAAKTPPKCGKGELLIESIETGSRECATECTDPSCNCEIGVPVLANGSVSSAPGDRRSFCPKAKAGAKKAVPKCPAGQSLFATDDSSPPFCSKSCTKDADCKPATCNQNLFGADETGTVFAGVGKNVFACNPGFAGGAPAASAGPASSAVVLAIPPGSPAVIQNPNAQPCPPGYGNGGKTCNKKCDNGAKCPVGSRCLDLLCR